jgi:ABC-type transporter Mla subunit MlaD
MREDPVDVERESRAQLSQAAAALRAEMDDTVRQFSSFRRATQQSIEEGIREVGESALKMLSQAALDYHESTSEAVSGIKGAFATLKLESRALDQSARRLTQSLEKLTERISQVEAPPELVTRLLDPFVANMAKLLAELARMAEAQGTNGTRLITTIGALERSTAAFSDAADSAASALQGLSREGVSEYRRHLDALKTELERIAGISAEIGDSQKQIAASVADAVRRQSDQCDSEMRRLQELSTRLAEQQQGIASRVAENAEALISQMEQQYSALGRAMSSETLEILDRAKSHRESLDAELQTARAVTTELTGQITSIANVLTEEFRRSERST